MNKVSWAQEQDGCGQSARHRAWKRMVLIPVEPGKWRISSGRQNLMWAVSLFLSLTQTQWPSLIPSLMKSKTKLYTRDYTQMFEGLGARESTKSLCRKGNFGRKCPKCLGRENFNWVLSLQNTWKKRKKRAPGQGRQEVTWVCRYWRECVTTMRLSKHTFEKHIPEPVVKIRVSAGLLFFIWSGFSQTRPIQDILTSLLRKQSAIRTETLLKPKKYYNAQLLQVPWLVFQLWWRVCSLYRLSVFWVNLCASSLTHSQNPTPNQWHMFI